MKDYAEFLTDVEENGVLVFLKGQRYEILDENADYYFIQRKKRTNEVSKFAKSWENRLFTI